MFPFARSWPWWVRSAITDFVETAITAVLALNLVFPGTVSEARQEAVVVAMAVLAALVAAARRATPSLIAWIKDQMGVAGPPSTPTSTQ